MTQRSKILLILIAAAMAAVPAAAADVIELRSEARVSGQSVTLGDIATLSGEYAEQFRDLQIASIPAAQDTLKLSMRQIRQALDEREAHLGLVLLRGAMRIAVTRAVVEVEDASEAMAVVESESAGVASANGMSSMSIAATANGSPPPSMVRTLRDHLIQYLLEHVDAAPDDVRIEFENNTDPLLEASLLERRFEIEPAAADLIGRVPIIVREYDADQTVRTHRVRALVTVRRTVVVAAAPLSRAHVIGEADVRLDTIWMDSNIKQPLTDLSAVIGQQASGVVRSGSVLYAGDVQSAVLVKRGQLVTVRCIAGALVIKTVARAMEDGASGDLIAVRSERTTRSGGRDEQLIHVRVSGPQEAVMVVEQGATAAEPRRIEP